MAHSKSVINLLDSQDDRSETTTTPLETPEQIKSSAPVSDTEDSPLLVNDGSYEPNLEAQSDGGMVSEGAKKGTGTTPWRRCFRWALENIMFVIVACLLAAGTVTLFVYFGVIYKRKPSPKPASICLTPTCVHAASEILYNLSPAYLDIDPCTNFDDYVCGGWQDRHELREDQGDVFTGTLMAEHSELLLRHVLEASYSSGETQLTSESNADKANFIKMRTAYRACMDEDVIKSAGVRPLLTVLRRIEELYHAGGPDAEGEDASRKSNQPIPYPLLQADDQLSAVVLYLTQIGVGALVDIYTGADDMDPDTVVTTVSAPQQLGLPSKEYYKNKDTVASYSKTIGEVLEALLYEAEHNSTTSNQLEILGHTRYGSNSEKLVHALVTFESKLAEASPDLEDAQDVTKYYNPRTLAETESLLPQMSFSSFFDSMAPKHYQPNRLIINTPEYLKSLSKILQETSKETLRAYFVWKVVQAYADKLEHSALKPLTRFNNELKGKDPDASEERWRKCVREVDDDLGWILSKFFVGKAFSKAAKEFGDRVVYDIKHQFARKLESTEWMTEDVRKLGMEKVKNIVQKIGYPTKSPDILDPAALHQFYETLHISKAEFFANALEANIFNAKHRFNALGNPTDRAEWGMTVPTVNAYYNPAGNEIVFPAGIMQSPVFYDPSVPQYLSYGAFGAVSGHELSHAFDSTGRHYDQNGNYTDWWDAETVRAFKQKADCFVDQYANFTIPGPDDKPLHVNGRLTLGENIADAGGIAASFGAWKRREQAHPGELLPGLQNFTKEQLFFMSYSNWWCGKSRKEAAIRRIYQDPHAPKWARILGTMSNSRDFLESFNCPTKEPTCELW